MNDDSLAGRVAVITGASRGLGKSMALALAGAGARLTLLARDQTALDSVAAEARRDGAEIDVLATDVTDEAQVQAARDRVATRWGKVHILINNAGINIRKPVTDFTLEEWRRVLDTNLTGAFLMCRALVPLMKGHDYGRIINLTSIMSHVSLPGRTAYSASKAGLLGLTRSLALELAPDKITVNGISPGVFATEMNQPLFDSPELSRQFLARIPLGQWGQPADIGRLVVFLCSDASALISGTDIVIDGGWTAQ